MRLFPVAIDGQLSLQQFIFECDAFGIVYLEPPLCGLGIGEGLDVIGVADAVSAIDINPDGFHSNISLTLSSLLQCQKTFPSNAKKFAVSFWET